MILQISIVLYGVPLVLVVLAIKALIMLQRVSCHLVWPFEERLILNLLQNLKYRFSEHRINHLGTGRPRLPNKVLSRSVVIVSVRLKISTLLRDNLRLPRPLLLVFLNPLILINSIHELAYTGSKFPSQRLPQAIGRPTLKVLMATLSKSPSISLNIS